MNERMIFSDTLFFFAACILFFICQRLSNSYYFLFI